MPEINGSLLPVYVVADESSSMKPYAEELNDGLKSLYDAIWANPMAADRVRIAVLGFSQDVAVRLALVDVRDQPAIPTLYIRSSTNYQAVFEDLLTRIPADAAALKRENYQVHRPVVFFLSDGQPSWHGWQEAHERLTDRRVNPAAPNIAAFGLGSQVKAETILQVATSRDFAFVSISGVDIGNAIAEFFESMTTSIIASGSSMSSENPEVKIKKPDDQYFTMAMDHI